MVLCMLFEVFSRDQPFQLTIFYRLCKVQGEKENDFVEKIFDFLLFSSFTQLLQQTGVVDQLKQSGRTYTLFIPTNAALQSIGVSTDMNRIRNV